MLVRYYDPVFVCPSFSVCSSQVGVLSKRLDGSSWFLAWRYLPTMTVTYLSIIEEPRAKGLPGW